MLLSATAALASCAPDGAAATDAPTEDTNGQGLSRAPDFSVTDADGNTVKLSDFRGKPVVLNFWATWCYYCKVEMPDFDAVAAERTDIQFLMVNATDGVRETVDVAKAYVEGEGYGFDVFYDTERDAVMTYGINSYPTTFFIDKDGYLVAHGSGMLDRASLEQGIAMITE